MNTSAFPNCCGAYILSQFSNTQNAIYREPITPEEVDAFLKRVCPDTITKSYVAILNDAQRNVLKDTFRANGFRRVSRFWHSDHRNFFIIILKTPLRRKTQNRKYFNLTRIKFVVSCNMNYVFEVQNNKIFRRKITDRDFEFNRVKLKETKKHFAIWIYCDKIDNKKLCCYFSNYNKAKNYLIFTLSNELKEISEELNKVAKSHTEIQQTLSKLMRQ